MAPVSLIGKLDPARILGKPILFSEADSVNAGLVDHGYTKSDFRFVTQVTSTAVAATLDSLRFIVRVSDTLNADGTDLALNLPAITTHNDLAALRAYLKKSEAYSFVLSKELGSETSIQIPKGVLNRNYMGLYVEGLKANGSSAVVVSTASGKITGLTSAFTAGAILAYFKIGRNQWTAFGDKASN